MTNAPKRYVGLDNEINGGMTDTAKIIRDAQVFGIIAEDETCEGWLSEGIQSLWDKVQIAWEPYGYSVGALPDDLRTRFMDIHGQAMTRARAAGWDGDQELAGDV